VNENALVPKVTGLARQCTPADVLLCLATVPVLVVVLVRAGLGAGLLVALVLSLHPAYAVGNIGGAEMEVTDLLLLYLNSRLEAIVRNDTLLNYPSSIQLDEC
jgi:hypothetical protein